MAEDSSDKDLIERMLRGEEDAFEELVRNYGGRLLAVTRRYLPSEDDARDAVQDAFLSAFRSLDRFERQARLSTWLHRIAVNAALMKLRTRRRKPEQSIEELLPGFLEDGHFSQQTPGWRTAEFEDVAERRELAKLVRSSIDRLPVGYRNVLMLRDIEEFNTEETALAMGISLNAVKTRLHRARLALRELLEPHMRRESK